MKIIVNIGLQYEDFKVKFLAFLTEKNNDPNKSKNTELNSFIVDCLDMEALKELNPSQPLAP